jgi:iron(III) transport system substrate-binding protein
MPMSRFAVFVAIALALPGCNKAEPRVVLYCAQDQEFAEPHFETFHQRTGPIITPKYDTEAKKTVGLLTELINEKQRPRCDVFWNNESIGTVRLRKLGLLQPYESPAAKPYPASAKSPDHTWYAFAQRARILLINTKLVPEKDRPRGLLDLTDPRWRGRVAMAVPLYGTTASQAACLFDVLGPEKAKEYYRGLKANGVQLAPGNKQVAEWVGEGQSPTGGAVAVGVTDTDDAMAEVEKGKPVTILFPDQANAKDGRLGTLFLPNTLCIIKGGPNPEGARKLVDFLLSPAIETALAEGESHQIPLNPEVMAKLPPALAPAKDAKAMQVDWDKAAEHWEEAAKFLAAEFGEP